MQFKISQITPNLFKIAAAPEDTFTYNHFLLTNEKPVWIHCGRLSWFPENLKAAQQILGNKAIRYFAFSHFEADECASLNNWLAHYKEADVVVGSIGEASITDFAIRPPLIVKNDEILKLGDTTLKVLETPHCPHNWDSCMFYETNEKILFCSDLGANPEPIENIITNDPSLIDVCIEFQKKVNYLTQGKYLTETLQRLKQLPIDYLAIQHGEMLQDQKTIRMLFDRFENEFGG